MSADAPSTKKDISICLPTTLCRFVCDDESFANTRLAPIYGQLEEEVSEEVIEPRTSLSGDEPQALIANRNGK